MRPIDADKLIELIKNYKIDSKSIKIMEATGCDLQAQTLNLACDRLIAMIKEQPTFICYGQWIPVTERPPEEGVQVLVTDDAGGLATIDVDWGYFDKEYGRFEWFHSQNVTAWMPKPKPWNGEKNEHNT